MTFCADIGPLDASMMLIGEAPGREEELAGIPFIGQAGHLLKSICKTSGIDYQSCYVTNISPERPPNNNFGYFYEDSSRNVPKESLRKKWFELADKIRHIKPRVVICLGNEPLRAVTNLRGIGSWRGTRIEAHGAKIIATYHPSSILRDATSRGKSEDQKRMAYRRVLVEMDLRKASRELRGINYQAPETIVAPTISQVIEWMHDAKLQGTRVSFDIETIGTMIRSIAFAQYRNGSITSISIPFLRMIQSTSVSFAYTGGTMIKQLGESDINYWSASDEETILESIASILENPLIEKVGQNSIHFDAYLIEKNFSIKVKNHKMDTMHAWHVLYPSLPKSLDFICSVITDHPNYWSTHDAQVDESEWYYNDMDAVVTLEASRKIDKELIDEGLKDLYYNHIHPLTFALLKAEQRGVLFDVDEAKKMKDRLSKEVDGIELRLNDLVGKDFNPGSSKQVKELLYDKLKFPVIRHHKTKRPTVDEDALRRLYNKYPQEPALLLIIQHRKTSKLISTYINVKLDEDGRIRCSYNASGTITGRISSSKTIFGTGMDLHNIPKGYTRGSESTRHLYIAGEGNIFVVGDLKQAEAMVVAWILKSLGDSTLYDFYLDPSFDIHRWCAANFVYLIDEKDVTKIQRNQGGKLANHSGNYMAGPRVMERRALKDGYEGFTYRKCKEVLQKRISGIPGLRVWWADVEAKLRATRTLKTCFGRRLQFFGRIEGEELRSAVAFEPQSVVGDVCNKMFVELSKSEKWYPVLTTHDEVVLETKERFVDEAARALLEASKIPLHLRPNVEPLMIPIEIMIGKNWGNLKEQK